MMNEKIWKKAKELFHEARSLPAEQRGAFLDNQCLNDQVLREQVDELLSFYDSEFLESSPLTNADQLLENDDFAPGRVIGRYHIRELIGTGGMGQVFRADDTELNRSVAFKVLHEEVAGDNERVRRFIQEARAASALNHPNILTIHEIGSHDGARFIVSEHVDGETLRERMHTGLTVGESLDVAAQVAAALQAAHEAGIVHRDIKPENIMLRRDGLVKVLDFGLAKLTEADDLPAGMRNSERGMRNEEAETLVQSSSDNPHSALRDPHLTAPGLVMGTAAYMSPEQAKGQAVDARTDLWSLGVVLHEMLTGKSPFEGETVTELITSILKKESPTLDSDKLPQELRSICSKALTKDKQSRYQSSQELIQDLQGEKKKMEYATQPDRYISVSSTDNDQKTQLIRRRPTLSAEYIVTGIKRHKYATLATVLLVIAGAFGVSVYRYNGMTGADGYNGVLPAIPGNETGKDLRSTRLPTSGRVYSIAISPDGKLVAYTTGDTGLKNPIRLRHQDSGDEVELVSAPASGRYYWPSFSPDGRYLYYGHMGPGGPEEIFRVSTSGGTPSKIVDNSDGGASVSPDGRFLAFRRDIDSTEELLVASSDGTQERVLVHTPYVDGPVTKEVSWIEPDPLPAWSPDGKKIAAQRAYVKPGGEVHYKRISIDVNTGSEQEMSDTKWARSRGTVWLANGDMVTVVKEASAAKNAPLQLWLFTPAAPPKQISNGQSGFEGITATAKGDILASVQTNLSCDLWLMPQNDGSAAKQITSSGELEWGFDWISDRRIVFVSRVTGNTDIWTMNLDGTGRKQLTKDTGNNRWPVASPDGRFFVFVSDRASSGTKIYRMDADGSNPKRLTTATADIGESSPQISRDGKWVYYIKAHEGSPTSICKIPIGGGESTILSTAADGSGYTKFLDVSSDGRVVYDRNTWVTDHYERTYYVIPPSGGTPISAINTRLQTPQISFFRWTPDGKSIAYGDLRGGACNIWTTPVDGDGKEQQLTNFAAGPPMVLFKWSPDGKQLLFGRATPTADGILITNTNR